jgi:hypothetical protein
LIKSGIDIDFLKLQSETWIKEGHRLLMEIQRHVKEFRSSGDAERLLSTLNKFIENGRPMQESRLQRMSELVIELYGKLTPEDVQVSHKIRPLQVFSMFSVCGQIGSKVWKVKQNTSNKEVV